MGKYTERASALEPLPPDDEKYQEKVNKAKTELIGDKTITADLLMGIYEIYREEVDSLKEQTALFQIKLTAVEQLLAESNDRDDPGWGNYGAGPTTVRGIDGASLSVNIEPTGKVIDRERFRLWCIANGYENSLQLHSGTMNSIVKDAVLKIEKLPDGVKAYRRPKISYRKAPDRP